MPERSLAEQRLLNQRLLGAPFATPVAAVRWLGAVQAQDYAGAQWALAQRCKACTQADVERAFDAGQILRTHVLRPTWHFVLPEDLRWLLALSAPRVHAASAYYYKKQGLDARSFRQSEALLRRALEAEQHLTRNELARALASGGLPAQGERLGLIMLHAELEAVVCSGPRRGKQFTYALVDERVPPAPPLASEAALGELARRYLQSHGPALVHDFAWWSGLSVGEARRGFALVAEQGRAALSERRVAERHYFSLPSPRRGRLQSPTLHLLPNYDEYLIAYKHHGVAVDADSVTRLGSRSNMLSSHIVVRDGKVLGGWKRQVTRSAALLELQLFAALSAADSAALAAEVERYGRFLGLPARAAIKVLPRKRPPRSRPGALG